ncbi:MAG: hypothetical protein KA765_04535 [Thermoflexales bacterium]|nr:hypothetical protein [Thermoflexales bacterium]
MFTRLIRVALCLIVVLIAVARPVQAQADLAAALLSRINALRVQSGLLPLAANSRLSAAATRLADDMAQTGIVNFTASDGSTTDSRIRATGFGYWRDFGVWSENIYGGQTATLDEAWAYWTGSQAHRTNLLSTRFREVGVAVAVSDKGTFFVADFGSQPNTLPFFVTGDPPNVTLLLTNENDITTGEGVAVMGQATEVRIAEGSDLQGVAWQPWAQSILFQLSGTGTRTITVEYRDELGRGTKSTRTITVSDLPATTDTPTPTSTPTLTSTPRVTGTPPTATPLPSTATPTTTPTPRISSTPVTSTPEATATASATSTATPSTTPQPTITPRPALPTSALPAATLPGPATLTSTPATAIALVFPTSVSASRLTPPAPHVGPTDKPLFASLDNAPGEVLLTICGLQMAAVALIALTLLFRARRKA